MANAIVSYPARGQAPEIFAARLNVQTLRTAATLSAGIAFHWHRIGLAGWLLRRTDLKFKGTASGLTLLTQGHYGLARDTLPKWLKHPAEDASLHAVMDDWLDTDHCRHLHACPNWQSVLLPRWHDGNVQWALVERSSIEVEVIEHAPGFDELSCYSLYPSRQPELSELSPQQSRDCFRDLLMLDAIGLIATGLGSLERAAKQAHDYAHTRTQGGTRIVQHPAVSLMLADIQNALQSSDLQLRHLLRGLPELGLGQVMSMRASIHPLLCKGADQAIQAHGGSGYMRDCGVEKVWREQHTLRRLSGTTMELRLFTATLENCA